MNRSARDWLRMLGPGVGLIATWVLFAVFAPATFIHLANQRLLLEHTVVVGAAAIGATWIIAIGGIDLSVGSNIAFGGMAAVFALKSGCSPALAALVGISASVAVGASIGALISGSLLRFPLSPFIVTLGAWGAVRGLAQAVGHGKAIYPEKGQPGWLGELMDRATSGPFAILPPSVWIMLAMALVASLALRYTVFGRHVVAIGSNEETARLCGVRVARVKVLTYALAGLCAGIAGMLQFAKLQIGDPMTAQGVELQVIAAVVIGGASLSGGEGSIWGTLIGALLMTVIDNGCTQLGLDKWVQEVTTGMIIVAAVALDRWRR